MPHLRLEVPEEWLREGSSLDVNKLLDHLVQVVAALRMDSPANETEQVPFINLSNLKHAIVPLHHAHVAGDPSKRFLHVTLSAGNDTPGRTAAVRRRVAETLGDEIDKFVGDMKGLASVTAHVLDIDRDRGYSTTAERRKKRT
jgi:5-carboxymethyl-2-hydroxymuconate isomerase